MQLPKRFLERMQELLGDEYGSFISSYDTSIKQGIRINTLKCADTAALARSIGATEPVQWCEDGYYADRSTVSGTHPFHAAGLIYFQEPSAMCVVPSVPTGKDLRVLDLCAAPGGKTTHMGAIMKNKGLLVANEIIPKRATVLAENTERLGLRNAVVTNASPAALAQKFPSFFDRIIVDAPCSGEGMFRKEPQAAEEWSEAHSLSCATRQKNILDDAYTMLRGGGYIIYSTCTFSYDENEAVVGYMLKKYNMTLEDIPSLSMLSGGIGEELSKCRRVFPHRQCGEGHFVALLKKNGEEIVPEKPRKQKKPSVAMAEAIRIYRDFEKDALNISLDGEFALFGDNLYLMPTPLDTDALRVIRCGLHLGIVKKGRFEPSHALSHALSPESFKQFVCLDANGDDIQKYMRGDVLPSSRRGWCVVGIDGGGIGWGKASGGVIKNHYPKHLRILK